MSSKARPLRAVSEVQLVQEFCKLLGVTGSPDTLDQARGMAMEQLSLGFLRFSLMPYPWIVPVAAHVMADKPNDQLTMDLLMTPDTLFLVRDENSTAGKGLFLAWSGDCDPCRGLPVRKVVNHFEVVGEMVKVTAIQLKSCLR